jgi:hypothetical protein
MDLGDVKTEQDCTSLDKTKDAAFGIDGFYVPDREVEKYIDITLKLLIYIFKEFNISKEET